MFATQIQHFSTYTTRRQNLTVFALLWVIIFTLYIPAIRAGFVVDFTGWLDQVKNQSFWDFINRNGFSVKSLYHFTQFVSWFFYQLFGTNAIAWHLLFVSLHALNASILFRLIEYLANVSGIKNSNVIAFASALFFCICPHVSEVIVWEPSFHYMLGLLMILGILSLTRKYVESGKKKYAYWSCLIFLLSVFSLEYFYLTPFFVLSYLLYLQYGVKHTNKLKQVLLFIVLPMMLIMAGRTVLFRIMYNDWVSRAGESVFMGQGFTYWIKPLKYVVHIVFMGRFWPDEARKAAYHFIEEPTTVYFSYTLIFVLIATYFRQFSRLSGKLKLAGLLMLWTGFGAIIVSPMWFPQNMLVLMDRYAYLMLAFCFPFLVVVLSLLQRKVVFTVLMLYGLLNVGLTLKLSRYWYLSERIIHDMLHEVPDPGDKIVILLNTPECFKGVPMIQACTHGEFKLMHDLLLPEKKLKSTIYEMASFNMESYWDGAHVYVVNDTLLRVTLNQWGTWWWRDGKGAVDHETEDYKLYMRDAGHWYDLVLKKPKDHYVIMYLVDGHLKKLNMDGWGWDLY